MQKIVFLVGLLFVLSIQSCEEQVIKKEHRAPTDTLPDLPTDFTPRSREYFTKQLDSLVEATRFNGNILIAYEDSLLTRSYGFADFRRKDSLELDDRFQLASVSKPLTAFATLLMVQEGKINLNDSIQKYLPDFPYHDITIHQLLSHRSGLSNYMYITDSAWSDKSIPLCNDDAYEILCTRKPQFYYPPDYKFNYCNTNYFLLAHILERVLDLPFEAIMAEFVFEPLGMSRTFIYSNMDYLQLQDIAKGSNAYGRPKADFYLNGVSGDKGVFSTTKDLYQFHKALVGAELLMPFLVEKMYEPHSRFNRRGKSYGYGFRLQRKDGNRIIYHQGWWRGYRSYFYHFPENRACIIALSNTTRGRFLDLKDFEFFTQHFR